MGDSPGRTRHRDRHRASPLPPLPAPGNVLGHAPVRTAEAAP
ncbi:hypothetical protein K378_05330 [Streptomyces sp. Amel2xB2]|nr:hypothetical protein K378_05330 [Streptomyces sp. Amel2xB2]